ncbi:MAG: bifunctional glutamate N-acetyltransferase/amino-acid acetyltransferase ArgJ [Deltaproteobacteria bacterium]|nr:bifunctional glutamate N-acetyltransferase/amino-acid acetyltransferase ArgJ [Deltaproteobacteria bacterium]
MKLPVRETPIRVPGFRFAGVACGIKGGRKLDLALVHSETPATVAGMFTRNRVKAAPVVIAARHVRRGRAQAVLINSGNANACTGAAGARVAIAACRQTGIALGISPYDVLPCSTGKIGVVLPAVSMVRGIDAAVRALDAGALWQAAHAMRTTDAFPKVATRRLQVGGRSVTIAGLAKGAGMIAPDVATLLVCVITDARVAAPALRAFLRAAVATSFNAITVDGDMSTNDTVLVLANGAAGHAPLTPASAGGRCFAAALAGVMESLADMVVADGEGATKRVRVEVHGAATPAAARRVARSIAGSQLVKTAFYGADPNWGRIVCAAGYAGVLLRPERLGVRISGVEVLRRGEPAAPHVVRRAAAAMRRDTFTVAVDLGAGAGAATITTSDLTPAYVRFNSAYST